MSEAAPPGGTDAGDGNLERQLGSGSAGERLAMARELLRRGAPGACSLVWASLEAAPWAERPALLEAIDARFPRSGAGLARERIAACPAAALAGEATDRAGRESAALAHTALALLALDLGVIERAQRLAEKACEVAPRELCLARVEAEHALGLACLRGRSLEQASRRLEVAREAAQLLGERGAEARVLDSLGNLHLERLELADAEHCFLRSVALKSDLGDHAGQAATRSNLGRLALFRGEIDLALEHFYRSRKTCAQLGDDHGFAKNSSLLAEAYLRAGDLEHAAACAAEGEEAARKSHDSRDHAFCERMIGWVALEAQDLTRAHAHLEAAARGFAAAGEDEEAAETELLRGRLDRRAGRPEAALARLEQARERFRELDYRRGEAWACLELSLVGQHLGDGRRQEEWLGQALAVLPDVGKTALRRDLHRAHAHLEAGRILHRAGVVEPAEVERVIETSYRIGLGLGRVLMRRSGLSEEAFGRLLRETLGIAAVDAEALGTPAVRETAARFSRRMAERLQVLPLEARAGRLRLAMADPLDFSARSQVELVSGLEVDPLFAPAAALETAIRRAWARPRLGLDRLDDAVLAMSRLFEHAVTAGASDIHLEPGRDAMVVRVRIDGVLTAVDRLRREPARRLLSTLKVRSGMDIAERRLPQDGRLRHQQGDSTYNLRLSTLPTLHGENLVVRILPGAASLHIEELGFDGSTVRRLKAAVSRQEGMLLVAGPTGSGKSTTLQAILAEVDAEERAVFTVEDPVEFQVPAFAQSQVDGAAGFGYAQALRALLRQDPNLILLGEIRDGESAEIATRMALTGHVVLSTVHAYDAATAVTRLAQVGVPAFYVAAVLKGVLAQRLVRRLCEACKTPVEIDRLWARAFDPEGELGDLLGRGRVSGPRGCERCRFLGYRGRVPVYEHLEVSAEVAELVRRGASEDEVRRAAAASGFKPMRVSAAHRVAAGETSQAEVARVL